MKCIKCGVFAVAAMSWIALSCQTTPPPETAALPEVAPSPQLFVPASFVVRIQHEKGNYADLFGPDSYAVWVGPEVTAMKREKATEAGETIPPQFDKIAASVAEDYLVFELHIESAFSDSSIAYDAVAFRGIDVYLLGPEGRLIPPIQQIIGTPVEEENREALKLFRRTNIVIFNKVDPLGGGLALAPGMPAAKLVLEGHGSNFTFEWPTAAPGTTPTRPSGSEALMAVKVGFKDFFEKTRRLAHIFD
ncbi:MAG: hypothetical protein HY706_12905 [Candidatus Hydrogenedentes bacterium]|nr:hypothetical protein [Candidatus Hydrogenedentota bacterium]